MASLSSQPSPQPSTDEAGPTLSGKWHDRLAELVSHGRKAAALSFLEQTIASSVPLFSADRSVFESRRAAWLIRTHLLLEWGRPAEALAWTCLECELASSDGARGDAKALRDRLKRQLSLDFTPVVAPVLAAESHWPGIAGMHELKATLERDLVTPLRFPADAARYGVGLPNGILLYGPPGCGKTFLARRIADKLGRNFREIKPGDLVNSYIHGTQGLIAAAFQQAVQDAPIVLFFDEIDALAPRREDLAHAAYTQEVNEFLVRLDGCAQQTILVIAATNFPDKLDPALLRAGRLEQHYLVGLPDFAARSELFRQGLHGRPHREIPADDLAALSEGYTAADVVYLCNQAARLALGESKKTGCEIPINDVHFSMAMRGHPPATVLARHTQIGFRP